MEAIIELKNVSKDYGQGDVVVHALKNINLKLEAGEFSTMAGPSGSGKSSLLNIIGGLDRPTSGEVFVKGNPVHTLSGSALSRLRRNHIGFVFQNYSLIPVLTAFENAEYILLLQNKSTAERREIVEAVLNEVGLGGLGHRFPRELSGGQQQRVAIARALATQPALILADEPTANLDSKTSQALLNLMENLNQKKGLTFLFSTHDRAVMERAHRLLWLHDGQITYDGKPDRHLVKLK